MTKNSFVAEVTFKLEILMKYLCYTLKKNQIHIPKTCKTFPKKTLKGCVCYIYAGLCLGLNESNCQMKKNVFYFTSKPLFFLEKSNFRILHFQISWHHQMLKGCVCYIFASLFFMSKREHLWSKEECFLIQLKSSFPSWDNQILTF